MSRQTLNKIQKSHLLGLALALALVLPLVAGCATSPTPEAVEKAVTGVVKETVKETVEVLGIGDCLAVDVAVHLCYNAFDCPRYHR